MPKPVDQRPGVLPDISAVGESVLYTFAIAGTQDEHLIVRCEPDGRITIAIAPKLTASRS